MKITYKGDYALKAILQLALIYEGGGSGILSITEIAKRGDMPENFLEQILLALRRGGFVKSRRGVNGGFMLARPPAEITIGQVIRYIEGPVEPISCVEKDTYKGCKDLSGCIFRDIWKEVRDAISIVVDTVSFEELVLRYRERSLRMQPVYEYTI
jgi:Rrf2 family protein